MLSVNLCLHGLACLLRTESLKQLIYGDLVAVKQRVGDRHSNSHTSSEQIH